MSIQKSVVVNLLSLSSSRERPEVAFILHVALLDLLPIRGKDHKDLISFALTHIPST